MISFFSPGLDNLLAIFSKGFLASTSIVGVFFFYYFLDYVVDVVVGLSFLGSLYLSRVDLLYV